MNYSQKRTLIGRIVYIGLTLMAVTVLCVTMYTFFGSSKEANKNKLPITTNGVENPPVTSKDPDDTTQPPVVTDPPATDTQPTVKPEEKDWLTLKVLMPVSGTVAKEHDLLNAVYSATMNDYRVHRGIDIECNMGDEVLSCAYGTVISVGIDPFMGTCVSIDHGDGLISVYKNLAPQLAEDIKEGAEVLEGQVIGTVGESAIIEIADEPHLHFELELDGEPIDPMKLLNYQQTSSSEE